MMKDYTMADANGHLDRLASNPDFAADVTALRNLIADDLAPGEIDFMLRGLFPMPLISVLVDAHRSNKRDPIIAA